MRQWLVDPKTMCRQHLLGEHVEHHMFVGAINKGAAVAGYLRNNLLEPAALQERHAALAAEMEARGYNHRSPLLPADLKHLTPEERAVKIDRHAAQVDLISRCSACAELYNRI